MSEHGTRPLTPGGEGASRSEDDFDDTKRVDAPPPPRAPVAPAPLVRGDGVGRYIILDRLGAGGMGVVYAAYDPELDRRVAIKLLLAAESASEESTGQARLVREAQALARLSHPNVIAVYDVGTHEAGVFVAMELVDGQTLREWRKAVQRPWREVLEVFLAAGRGLAAAHAAGLVHRDFKPDNVLLGEDGRVRVLDFGLARQADGPSSTSTPIPDARAAVAGETEASGSVPLLTPSRVSVASHLTQFGVVRGTPAYMAPEQFKGEASDTRSDQFSFCAALYEALYGVRPFGKSPGPSTDWKAIPEAPKDSRVPGTVRRIVLKGLSPDPAARFASMEVLLEALSRRMLRRQRGWVAAGAGLAALALAAVVTVAARPAAVLCTGAEKKLASVWDASRKEALSRAFAATGNADAAAVWQRVVPVLDTYAQGWVAMHTDTCEATRVRGEQSDEVLSLRMECLDRRLQSFSALTSVYAQADGELLDQAVKAVHALPQLEGCADVQSLRAPVPPPEDAATLEKVDELRDRLAETQALFDSGRYQLAVEKARALTKDAAALAYAPLHAEALELHGALEERVGDLNVAEATLKHAVWAAEAGRHDEVAASAAARIVRAAYLQGDNARAREWAEFPQAKVRRMGGNARVEGSLLNSMGVMFLSEANGSEALAHFERALVLRQEKLPPDHPDVAAALSSVGMALVALERFPEARQRLERALGIEEKLFGPNHLETARTLANLGHLASDSGDHEEAFALYQRALGAFEAALGPDRPEVADALDWVATSLNWMARFDEALAYRDRVLALRRRIFGPEHMMVASALNNRGLDLQMMGKLEDALAHFREAQEMKARLVGASTPQLGVGWLNIGNVLLSLERPAEARSSFERALACWKADSGKESSNIAYALEGLGRSYLAEGQARTALGRFEQALTILERLGMPEHPDLVGPLSALGKVRLAMHAPRAALPPLERALKLIEHPSVVPETRAEVRFLLAQAEWDTGGDKARALSLAQRAREELALAGNPKDLASVESWLRAHGPQQVPSRR